MNILLYDMSSFIQPDLIYYLTQAGHHCQNIRYKFQDNYKDEFFSKKFCQYLEQGSFDCVISTNFFPLIAKLCNQHQTKYISWVYDSPIDCSHIEYFQYSTNYTFLFDRIEAEKLTSMGGVHIFHLPLAVNTNRLDKIIPSSYQSKYYQADISFVGTFYENTLQSIRQFLQDYDKGYLDALVQTQLQIYGSNILDHIVTEDFIARINQGIARYSSVTLDVKQIINTIEKQITYIERTSLCHLLGLEHNLKYYSDMNIKNIIPHITWMGTAHYFSEMPQIFKCSRLNLNITLKGIQSGIPLRALDIMGCSASLLSNYQLELAEYFEDGKDIIMYESMEDAISKADFYLRHEDLRKQIAMNGYQKVKECFSYPQRLEYILKKAKLQ